MDTAAETRRLIEAYFDAMDAGDWSAMLDLLHPDVVHDINEGGREVGRAAFNRFLDRMACDCREEVGEVEIMVSPSGHRAAAEFIVRGAYLAPVEGPVSTTGHHYEFALGAFFEVEKGLISRVTTYCNVAAWLSRLDCH